jgi:hypothetical protein
MHIHGNSMAVNAANFYAVAQSKLIRQYCQP